MDRFEAMQVFCKVVEIGSFAGAADKMDMSTSAVSRQLAQLEAALNARLLHRTTRRISLTTSGQAYYERCLQLLADMAEAEELVGSNTIHPRGTLRLTAPLSFGASHLAPALGAFAQSYPDVRFDVMLADRLIDLTEEGLDLAIRIGSLGNQNMVARRIGSAKVLLCASPQYLEKRGLPRSPQELSTHDCLTYAYTSESDIWSFEHPSEAPCKIKVKGPVHANNGTVLAELAAAGMGITSAPDFLLAPFIQTGRLQPILVEWQKPSLPISGVYPSRKHLSAKVRTFLSFLENWLAQQDLPQPPTSTPSPKTS
jgi:DNA-binding transcriptional LysR family regulator